MKPAAEALVLGNQDLVELVAWRVARRMPAFVEIEELVAWGNLGLVQAAERFDPQLHVSFRAFAMLRIRGAMIDAYRGRNYPRRTAQMYEEWLGREIEAEAACRLPEALIDRRSPLEALIDREQCVVISIDAVRARANLKPSEGQVLDRHLRGERLNVIAKRMGKSPAWARYTLFESKAKLRKALPGLRNEEEAA